jgi:cystathionine beta-lyase
MNYDFDKRISRRGTHSLKWEFIQDGEDLEHWRHTQDLFSESGILPMWVADMDFPCPDPVIHAVINRAKHGIYGYTVPTPSVYLASLTWMKKRHNWTIYPEWICFTPGVVPALNLLIRTFISHEDKVLLQPPVYYPFFNAVKNNNANIVMNPLIYENGYYRMDFNDLKKKVGDPKVKMAILCNPHNPVGRVWTEKELAEFGEICINNEVLVISDEIHGDLVFKNHRFSPFAKISEPFAQNTIICTSPSKTFNMAGLQTSCIIIPNSELRKRFKKTLIGTGIFGINPFGAEALVAAYTHGEDWLEQVLEYIEGNLAYLKLYIAENIPQLSVIEPEGTYLVWIDCSRLRLNKWELRKYMLTEARVYMDEGFIFGPGGEGFERMNIACPRPILKEALNRIRKAVIQFKNT